MRCVNISIAWGKFFSSVNVECGIQAETPATLSVLIGKCTSSLKDLDQSHFLNETEVLKLVIISGNTTTLQKTVCFLLIVLVMNLRENAKCFSPNKLKLVE